MSGLDVRLKLTDELFSSIAPKPERKNGGHPHPDVKIWGTVRKHIEDLLGTRRRIAHHPVSSIYQIGTAKIKAKDGEIIKWRDAPLESWWQNYVSEAERTRGRDEKTKPLKIADLKSHYANVQHASGHIFLKTSVMPEAAKAMRSWLTCRGDCNRMAELDQSRLGRSPYPGATPECVQRRVRQDRRAGQ
jgi:hypothetical protein